MTKGAISLAGLLAWAGLVGPPAALAQAPMMPVEQVRTALEATARTWIQFRDYDGRQWVYFTGLVTWKCGLKEIRYSINGRDLAERFPLPECDPQMPFQVDPTKDQIYLRLAPGEAETVSVQIVYSDGVESPVRTYRPCDAVGDSTCGRLAE